MRVRISERQFRQIVRLFSLDLDATQIVAITRLNHNTGYLYGIRSRLADYREAQSLFFGEAEVDESYFGAKPSKVSEDGVLLAKPSFSESSNALAASTRKSSRIAVKLSFKPLSGASYSP